MRTLAARDRRLLGAHRHHQPADPAVAGRAGGRSRWRSPPEAAAFASLLVRGPDGWRLTAPDEATLAELRAAGGLAADARVIVPLEIRIACQTAPGQGPLVAS